jgi:hypothetical protein
VSQHLAERATGRLNAYAVTGLIVLAAAVVMWWMVLPGNPVASAPIGGSCMSWLLLIAAVRSLRNIPRRRIGTVIMAGTLLLGLAAVSGPPRTSNDSARYAWDGMYFAVRLCARRRNPRRSSACVAFPARRDKHWWNDGLSGPPF